MPACPFKTLKTSKHYVYLYMKFIKSVCPLRIFVHFAHFSYNLDFPSDTTYKFINNYIQMYLMYRHVDCLSKNELNRMPCHYLSRLHTMERDFSEFFDGRRFLLLWAVKEMLFPKKFWILNITWFFLFPFVRTMYHIHLTKLLITYSLFKN